MARAVLSRFDPLGRFPSGQRGQTVNLLAYAFEGSNPSLPIAPSRREGVFFQEPHRREEMSEPFYAEGLRFSCERCSACCRGEPGYVFLTKEDLP